MSPVTGPVATAIAMALAVALGVASAGWETRRARYEARIVELSQAAERNQVSLRTELASCRAAGEARQLTAAEYAAKGPPPDGAKRLLEQQPEGIDACARMESADRAVLSNLKR
ncbi:hypothetical protein [Phenylobacterium sp.]|uniref:hypothetical protein n=1 Tax=Phenylobacterium sp. TaxID=1871053 RepID=UPI0025DB0BC4|nr:hypothetical protein [Phenylobacterium sp.]